MKQVVLTAFILMISISGFSQENQQEMESEITTYYFIRHAEKNRIDAKLKDPKLNADGLKRAENWSKILGNIKFDAVYSTDYSRTIETGQPIATNNNLKITIYKPDDKNEIKTFLKNTKGKTVLIVGHSNTIPDFVNAVIGQKKYDEIDDTNNGNLYIVTFIGKKVVDQVLTIN